MTRMEPQFLDIQSGRIFCQKFCSSTQPSEHLLIISPPFADEMNKSRRQLALFARSLNQQGIDVILPDWLGTGDSSGEFADATLQSWRVQFSELIEHTQSAYGKLSILALRSGSLVLPKTLNLYSLLLWQPVVNGELFLNQFLRMKVMAEKMAGRNLTVKHLLQEAANGETIECAGYQLNPQMIAQFLESTLSLPQSVCVDQWLWLEASSKAQPARAGLQLLEELNHSCRGQFLGIPGSAFWQTSEIETNPQWIKQSTNFLIGNEPATGLN